MVIYTKNDIRISIILPSVLRVEKGSWTDLPTQTVQYRDMGQLSCTIEEKEGGVLRVLTEEAEFVLDAGTGVVHSIRPAGEQAVKDLWRGILPGTARTLDGINGAVRLEKGILSRSGVSVLDDSRSLLLGSDGQILPRPACSDRYYFACGKDYQKQLQTFFRLAGSVPLIPKFALGNWWSRYRAYTQEEYRGLMQQFIDRKIPITVATIDMDWHWTDVVRRFGEAAKPEKPKCKEEILYNTLLPGWTGYTWNTELFPDHKALLHWLHEKGFKVTLNVHPSQGIRFFEDAYGAVCRRMGKDPETKECIPFDPADQRYMQAYFEEVHHPLEREGVDFWWLDWQQGKATRIPDLDPLWALNHYHTQDMTGREKRPLILSRYAGLGSHRYPLGFSGDAVISWKSLAFQPYFTNTAANAGYTWWSHDIGGHAHGVQNDELYLRWLQYGVFSPINRLHSTNSEYMGKEPWKRSWAVQKIAEDFLRLRHKLIPYLYSENYQTHTKGMPLCAPLYYRYDCEDAYRAKNQYLFGSQLMVSPITQPADKRLNLAHVDTWLPEGRWTDIFTNRIYEGGRWVKLYRDLDTIPVLAREGSIVPMYRNCDTNDLSLEQPLQIHIWRGNGHFELYEDDGETMAFENGRYGVTVFDLQEQGNTLRLTITPPADPQGLLPEKRKMYIKFRDVLHEELCITVSNEPIVVELKDISCRHNEPAEEWKSMLLTRVQARNNWKNWRFRKSYPRFVRDALSELDALADHTQGTDNASSK